MSELSRRDVLRTALFVSAGSLIPGSPLASAEALAMAIGNAEQGGLILGVPEIDVTPRERLLFDFNWRFVLGHGSDPSRDLGFGSRQDDFAKTGAFEFAQPKYDDSGWRALNLPHDWAVELPFADDKSLESHGYKPLGRRFPETSVGWYRRVFDVPESDAGRRIYLDFDGAFRSALVFCNGAFIGRNDCGYTPFRFDLTDFLNYGEKNAITVRMDTSFGDGWFYEGAGIYRHVWLTKTDVLHLGQWDTVVRPEVQDKNATLNLSTMVENTGTAAVTCRVGWKVFDGAGRAVATANSPASAISPEGRQAFSAVTSLTQPAIWSQEEPNLYHAVATVEANGKVCDRDKVSFGVRTLTWDVDRGFLLNGNKVALKGTCNHQDHAGVGAALPDRLQSFRVEVLKGMGCNAVRTSHNNPTPEYVDACDRLGMLMLCETRTMSSSDEAMAQLEKMIKRYRNSPSIFLWSMGNEEWYMRGAKDNDAWRTREDEAGRVIRAMQQRSHDLDPTRLCTAAVNGYYNTDLAHSLDVMGFNYNLSKIDPYRRQNPKQPLIGTETASEVCTRGIYVTDKQRNWVSSYDQFRPGSSVDLPRAWWNFYAARPWLSGGFAWTGFDYRGEPSPYAWPSISSQFGIVDTCGFPKDSFFYYKAWWSSQPVLHLYPHWNWAGKEGSPILVQVESNLDSVELFLNGHSLGSKKVEPHYTLEWMVNYTPGVLEARGTKNGKEIMRAKRETTGAPAQILLATDRSEIRADGQDVAIVRVEAVDEEGRLAPTSDNLIQFEVSGNGALIGVGNGDPNCHESDKGDQRSLFNGLAQAILQASKTPGLLTIQAVSPGLKPATLVITTKAVKLYPAVP